MQAIKGFVGLSESTETAAANLDDPMADVCTLTTQQRFIGFGSCFTMGMLISFLATLQMLKPMTFGLLYSLGNIVSFLSTGFLIGPKRQLKSACEAKRAAATIIFFVSIVGTITAAVYVKSIILVLILIVIQFSALVWYTASYIPFAQSFITSTLQAVCRRGT